MQLLDKDSLALAASRLKEGERLELTYDWNNNLIAIQKVKLSALNEPIEGVSETEIIPGGTGRVAYQGTSWKAQSNSAVRIAKGAKVIVIARYDLTLLVIPAS